MTESATMVAEAAPTPEVKAEGLDFGVFSAGLDEPKALTALRRGAYESYKTLSFPSTKTEEWRYTDLSKVGFESYAPTRPDHEVDEAYPTMVQDVLDRSGDRSGIIVQRNGRVVHAELDPSLAEQGVVFCSLEHAAAEYPELLARTLDAAEPAEMEQKIWTLSLAFSSGGYLLYIPRDVRLEAPVHSFRIIDQAGSFVASQSLVLAESGAEGAVIDEFVSEDIDALSVHSAVVDGGDNATIDYVALQRYGRGVKHFSIQHLISRRDARLGVFNVQLGASLSRGDVSSRLLGQGCDSRMHALWFGDSDQHFDHHTLQLHAEPHAASDLLFKGALSDSSTSIFRGLIRVDPGAQLTDAYQTNRNLLLSDKAKAIALPSLEIEADDVRCSHGATIGQVDDAQLFYLMARGLTRQQAERLLVFGFFEEVLARIPMSGVRARVLEAIEGKIGV
ncbi:MAG: Fe-S cluster assembly protein SufD [Gemmatimonadota bacterium]|nr:Fe-S cluster assembly protein SufD [Gemmatimonadota bacterium]